MARDAVETCRYLREDGKSLADVPQDVWRLPSVEEAVRSMCRGGTHCGGTWDAERQVARYKKTPDKESPLWDVYSPVVYRWTVDRGHLNSDLHTDDGPDGRSLSYRRGRAERDVSGEFTAATEGTHGWFWRNRSDEVVTMTLRVRGDYRGVVD